MIFRSVDEYCVFGCVLSVGYGEGETICVVLMCCICVKRETRWLFLLLLYRYAVADAVVVVVAVAVGVSVGGESDVERELNGCEWVFMNEGEIRKWVSLPKKDILSVARSIFLGLGENSFLKCIELRLFWRHTSSTPQDPGSADPTFFCFFFLSVTMWFIRWLDGWFYWFYYTRMGWRGVIVAGTDMAGRIGRKRNA